MIVHKRNVDLRILQCVTDDFSHKKGGLETYVNELNRTRISYKKGSNLQISINQLNWSGNWILANLKLIPKIYKLQKENEILECHFILSSLILVLFWKKPIIVFYHSPWNEESRAAGNNNSFGLCLRKKIEKWYLKKANIILTVGFTMEEHLKIVIPSCADKVFRIGAGVNFERFVLKSSVNFQKTNPTFPFIVFCLRRLEPRMGIDTLITAWSKLTLKHTDKLIIGGTGSLENDLKILVDKLGVSSSIKFVGDISNEEVVKYYQDATVSVVPTLSLEGFGLIVIESLACGTPVLVSNVDELTILIQKKWPDLVFPKGNANLLAHKLRSIKNGDISLPNPRECRIYAEEFSWSEVAQAYEEMLKKLLHF